ncbi:MAG: hypothetical protein HUJ58_05505 [Erysipelotrichaceae bacterium]|nr:hypothetical protein [Erysipelotrichaceae bacterium]
MALYDAFSAVLPEGAAEAKYDVDFDGTAKEYLEQADSSLITELLNALEEAEVSVSVCTNFRMNITDNVTNQIIRYRDAYKIPQPALVCPYILYWTQDGKGKAVIVSDCEDGGYLYAKGLYYCFTEPNGFFDKARNDVLALTIFGEETQALVSHIQNIQKGKYSVGAVQRQFDRKYVKDMENLKTLCVDTANRLIEHVKTVVCNMEDRGPAIYDTVAKCFLLKKTMYVQFMMTKNLLDGRFGGDIRKQRQAAKQYTDEIPLMSYSDMWRYQTPAEV